MKMMLHLFVLLLLLLSQTFAVTHTELIKGKELKNETIEGVNTFKYYKFTVESGFQGDKDITIKTALRVEHPWANPDIYLAKEIEEPTVENHQLACAKFGEDICSINMNELKPNQTWYVGVQCSSTRYSDQTCAYDIVIEYVDEIVITDGQPVTVYLYEDEERIFKYFVPDQNDLRHIMISARGKDVFSKFQLLTVKGNDPPGTDRRRHSWPAWNNGYVSRFEPGCDCFCSNCNYTAMIQADTEGYYTITAKTSNTVESIKDGEIFDTVFKNRNNCYDTYIGNPDKDMRIKMKVYSGDPDLYVHPKEIKPSLNQFKYNTKESMESEELVLTPAMREDDQNIVGTYVICVMGRMSSSFKIEVRNDENMDYMLESGLGESGYLKKDQTINYWYREDILKQKTNITFQLHTMAGSARLKSKFCSATSDLDKSKQDCILSKTELQMPDADEKVYIGLGKEIIQHDPKSCNGGNPLMKMIRYEPPTCMYNIGIIGLSEGVTHYGVTLRHQEGHSVLLAEGQMIDSSLAQGQYDYYKISINDDTVTELTIQLLSIHGDPDLFVSKKDEFPSNEKFERKGTICGRFPDTIVYGVNQSDSDDNLIGDYYIAVLGFVESSYHIYYHTERTDKDDEGNTQVIKLPVKLHQSKPVRGVLNKKDDYLNYKFNIANITTEDEIIVQLTPQNGKFKFAVKYDGVANKTNFDKVGGPDNHYTVVFNPNREAKYKNGEYSIYVYPIISDDLSNSGMSYTFLMNYYIGSHHIPLLEDQPTMGYTKKDKVNYYSYAFRNEAKEVVLTLTQVSGRVNAVMSVNPEITFPSMNDVDDTNGVFHTTFETTTFNKTTLEKYCSHGDSGHCKLTVAILAVESEVESSFVLTAKAGNDNYESVSKIENGMPQHGSVKANEWQYYYFKTSKEQPVTAVTVPNGGDPNIYVTIVTDLEQKESQWVKPTKDAYLKSSSDSIGADLLILNKKDLANCKSSCLLIFGVTSAMADSRYTLTVTRGLTVLKEHQAYTDSLGAWGNYKFYDYYRSCADCTTTITVFSPMNNGFNVYINFNITDHLTSHQNSGVADFKIEGVSGHGEISISSEMLKEKGMKDLATHMYIEVHSHSNLNYTISASSSSNKLVSIEKGTPMIYKVQNATQELYYIYEHDSSAGFAINLQEEYGYVELSVDVLPTTQTVNQYMQETHGNGMWSTYQPADRSRIEIQAEDGNFCKKCTYIIRVMSETSSKGLITVQEIGAQTTKSKMTMLKLGVPVTTTMQSTSFQHYKFMVTDDTPMSIDVKALSGTVEYEITTSPSDDSKFGAKSENNKDLVFRGNSTDSSRFVFSKDTDHFKEYTIFYLTIKSSDFYSRIIVSAGHVGIYSQISDATPQTVVIDGTTHMYYYYVDPNPGKSKVLLQIHPKNRLERFTVYTKLVKVDNMLSDWQDSESGGSTSNDNTEWQLSPEQVVQESDHKLEFTDSKRQKMLMTLEVTNTDDNSINAVLIAVKTTSNEASGYNVDMTVSSSNVEPLTVGPMSSGTVINANGVFKIYELFITKDNDEAYVIEVTPCSGQVEMYVAKDFDKLLKNNFISHSNHLTNGRLFAKVENHRRDTRKVLVAIKSMNNMTDEYRDYPDSDFKIQVRKYPKDIARNTYIQRYFVPKEAEIDWEILDDDSQIQLTWPKIYNSEGTDPIPDGMTYYEVYVGIDQREGMESSCAIESLFPIPINPEPLEENTFVLDLDEDQFDDAENIFVNVIGHVEGASNENGEYEDYAIAYHPLRLNTENIMPNQHVFFGMMFWLILIGVIALLTL